MGYTTDKFCGYIQEDKFSFRYSGEELCEMISRLLEREANNIPVKIVITTARSGSLLFGKSYPLIELSHPSKKFSKIGVFINGNILSFPYLSLSKELFKKRARGIGSGTKPSDGLVYYLHKENLAEAQQEEYWHARLLSCINAYIN